MGKTVAIVGSAQDRNAGYVADAVKARGAKVVLVETDDLPEWRALSWNDGSVRYQGKSLDEVRVFYVKGVHLSLPAIDTSDAERRNFQTWQERYGAERERHSFITAVLRSLRRPGRTLVNPVESFDLHFLKLHQLALLREAGIPVPPTLGSCDPDAVRAFVRRHKRVIYKPCAGGALVRRVSPEDLEPERLELLRNSPVLFQKEIQGDEFRAYVLDGEPVAAFHIPTEGVVDAREALHKVAPAKLPKAAWKICLEGAEALGLVFTAVDLRRTRDGEFVALEYNPTPAISYFDDPKDGVVMTRLADFLVARA